MINEILKFIRLLLILSLPLFLASCAIRPTNFKLAVYDERKGYRFDNLSSEGNTDELFIILAFSGGGTRSAAFSFGLLEALRDVIYDGGKRRLLDDVDVISAVSGGSFTAAYFGLFREQIFSEFPSVFLHRDIQGDLIRRALLPSNWVRLASASFNRSHLAAEYYDEKIFKGKPFAALLEDPRKPFIILNATDMTLARPFEFTQDQFDLLCSDLSAVKIGTAVAASSAFPVLLSPVTLENFGAEGCNYSPPQWLRNALDRDRNPQQRNERARDIYSYLDPRGRRQYIHLLDGGIADNIGLRTPLEAMTGNDSNWSLFEKINQRKIRRFLVIAANAKTRPSQDWDQRKSGPSLLEVLSMAVSGPMDNYSTETLQTVRNLFREQKEEEKFWADCRSLLQDMCPSVKMPAIPDSIDMDPVEISFYGINDEHLRLCMENLPTSFHLTVDTVTLLRQLARFLLMNSVNFRQAMRALDSSWKPSEVQIDPGLRARVCPG